MKETLPTSGQPDKRDLTKWERREEKPGVNRNFGRMNDEDWARLAEGQGEKVQVPPLNDSHHMSEGFFSILRHFECKTNKLILLVSYNHSKEDYNKRKVLVYHGVRWPEVEKAKWLDAEFRPKVPWTSGDGRLVALFPGTHEGWLGAILFCTHLKGSEPGVSKEEVLGA